MSQVLRGASLRGGAARGEEALSHMNKRGAQTVVPRPAAPLVGKANLQDQLSLWYGNKPPAPVSLQVKLRPPTTGSIVITPPPRVYGRDNCAEKLDHLPTVR